MSESKYQRQEPLTVTPERLPDDVILGFRALWLSGETPGGAVKFEVDHNAGLGGASISITVTQKDKPTVQETIDLRPLVQAWVSQIVRSTEPSSSTPLDGLEEFANPEGGVVVSDA